MVVMRVCVCMCVSVCESGEGGWRGEGFGGWVIDTEWVAPSRRGYGWSARLRCYQGSCFTFRLQ